MSANPISDPLAFPLPGFTPGVPGYDPNWYDPNYNPYGEPTPPVVPDMAQPAPPAEPPPPTVEAPPPLPPPLPGQEQGDPRTEPPPEVVIGESPEDDIPWMMDLEGPYPPMLPPGGLWTKAYDDGSADIDTRPVGPFDPSQPGYRWPRGSWGWDPVTGIHENSGSMNIVDPGVRRAGTIFGPGSPIDPPDVYRRPAPSSPTPSDVLRRGAAERDRILREAAQQAARDTAIRSGAAVVIEGIARAVTRRGLPPGIRDVLFPETLAPGTISTEEAITRGLPQIPEPVITQPPPLPLPSPPAPEMTPPWPQTTTPAPLPTSTPAPSPSSRSTPPPATPATVPARSAIGQLAGLWTSVLRRRSGISWPWREPFTDPLTQMFADTARVYGTSTPSTTKGPGSGTSPAGAVGSNPLTGSNVATLSWSPPRTPTRTRTREDRCDCKPKKRKKARDCNVRGNLMWVSGPKKGKPAGSRCVNFKGLK